VGINVLEENAASIFSIQGNGIRKVPDYIMSQYSGAELVKLITTRLLEDTDETEEMSDT
jgi:hypothetical protein